MSLSKLRLHTMMLGSFFEVAECLEPLVFTDLIGICRPINMESMLSVDPPLANSLLQFKGQECNWYLNGEGLGRNSNFQAANSAVRLARCVGAKGIDSLLCALGPENAPLIQAAAASILEQLVMDKEQTSQAFNRALELTSSDDKYVRQFALRLIASIGNPDAKCAAGTLARLFSVEKDPLNLNTLLMTYGRIAEGGRGNFSQLTGTTTGLINTYHFSLETRLCALAGMLGRYPAIGELLTAHYYDSNTQHRCALIRSLQFAPSWEAICEWKETCDIPDDDNLLVATSWQGLKVYHGHESNLVLSSVPKDPLDPEFVTKEKNDFNQLVDYWLAANLERSDKLGWPWPYREDVWDFEIQLTEPPDRTNS